MKQEGYVLGNYNTLGVQTRKQDAPKHYFFCQKCEQSLGEAENYLAYLTRGTREDLHHVGVDLAPFPSAQIADGPLPSLSGVNDTLIFRGLSGIALKTHPSPHQVYRRQTLSRGEVAALRRFLLSDTYPTDRMAIYAQKLFNRTIPKANPRATITIVFVRKHGGVIIHVVMAGMAWALFLGPAARLRDDFHAAAMPPFIKTATDPWPILPAEWAFDPTIQGPNGQTFDPDEFDFGRTIHPSETCPCGLDATFADCCMGRWLPATTQSYVRRGTNPVF